ncbi:MAG TPA: hypothetical protein VGO29_03420 [Solirubrobacteraceae bacterium]|nr:hypothetical protein [Solirubrobacteraceae bacterium]
MSRDLRYALHLRNAASALALIAVLLTAAGCGSAGESVARLEGVPHGSISPSTLDHWMQATVGGDFRRTIGTEGPAGLVSEPANYPRCIAAARFVAPRSFFNQLRYTRAELEDACRQLYRAIKAQTLSFLISSEWTLTESAKLKLGATAAEVQHALEVDMQKRPTREDLGKYLTERRWSLADLLYQLKLNVLAAKLVARLRQQASETGGGTRALVRLTSKRDTSTAAKTTCRHGFVVPGCREYRTNTPPAPSSEVVLKRLTGK